MKALILAAGFGTRLGSLTKETPKALIKVGSTTIIDHNIRKLVEIGISEILINSHYLADQIESYLIAQSYPIKVSTFFEQELLGTAGTLKARLGLFGDDDFIVMHGDNYFQSELNSLVKAHVDRSTSTYMTMATFKTDRPESCGTVLINEAGIVVDFFEKVHNSPSNEANSAIYVFSHEALGVIKSLSEQETDISKDLIPKMLGRIQAHHLDGDFIDIGTPSGLSRAIQSHALKQSINRK